MDDTRPTARADGAESRRVFADRPGESHAPPYQPQSRTGEPGDVAAQAARPAAVAAEPAAEGATPSSPADLVFIVRQDGEIRFANRPVGSFSEEEIVGSSIFEWIAPSHREVLRQSIEQVFATGRPQVHDLAGLPADGEGWFEWRIKPNRREGAVVSATLVAHDISRHKRTQHELQQRCEEMERLLEERAADLAEAKASFTRRAKSQEAGDRIWQRFRTLLDEAGEAIFITDPVTRRLVDVNETACRWVRSTRDALIGQPVEDLHLGFPVLPPDDADLSFTETRDTRRPIVLDDGFHRRGDGSTFPVEVAVARHTMGQEQYVLAVVRDIKARHSVEATLHEAEARYRALFNQAFDAIYLTDRGGEIVDGNHAAMELFGYSGEELIGLDARRLFSRPQDIRAFQRSMTERGSVDSLEVELETKAGTRVRALLSATRRLSTDGEIRGYQCVVRRVPTGDGRDPGALPTTPAPAVADHQVRETVLLFDPDAIALAETTAILQQADIRVLTADSSEGTLELFWQRRRDLTATVLAVEPGHLAAQALVEEMRRLDPAAPILLLSDSDPVAVAEHFADLGILAFLQKPTHPLALVQRVRQARGSRPAS
ncbi:MAG: PAS domain S-box protein [Gemmatimonadota bacterium]|nr:MAG: PAS domain S-box protein [Gemmatimonadota bacterium]